MHRAGQTPAHNSQPMHFSIPSSYRLRTCRPWNRSGFSRFSCGYRSVSLSSNMVLNVTLKPSRNAMSAPPQLPAGGGRGVAVLAGASRSHADGAGQEEEAEQPADGHADRVLPPADLDGRDDEQPEQRDGDHDLPAEIHQLVVPQAGQRGPEPHVHRDEDEDLDREVDDGDEPPQDG